MFSVNKTIIIIIAFAAALLTACEKEPIDLTIDPLEPIEVETEEKTENALIKSAGKMLTTGFAMDCITIIYPFSFELESGATITINDSIDAELALSNEKDYAIDFVYPLKANDQNRNSITINNIEALVEAFIECVPTEGWGDFEEAGFPAFEFEGLCVDLVYPLALQSVEDTTMVVTNEQEFADALVNGYYYFDFPINLIDLDGNTISANDEEGLINALFDCETYNEQDSSIFPFDFSFCFEIVFPVALIDELENISTVNSVDELYTLLFTGQVIDFVYPITVTTEDGTTVIVDDENVVSNLIADCFDFNYYYGDTLYYYNDTIDYYIDTLDHYYYYNDSLDYYLPFELCFQVQFPVEVTYYPGDTLTANNQEELYVLLYGGKMVDFVYPITVTTEYGVIETINNQAELLELCSFFENEGYNEYYGLNSEAILGLLLIVESSCFEVDFPFSITIDGTENTFNNERELESTAIELFSSQNIPEAEINFPFTVTLIANGNQLTIEDINDLYNYSYNCP